MKINEYWKRFAEGEQWTHYENGELVQDNKDYWWEERPVYNIIQRYVNVVAEGSRKELFKDGGIVSKLAPYQKMYNHLKAKGITLLNKRVYSTVTVEDGSVDVDALEGEGLAPGKVLVYRQGAKTPTVIPIVDYKSEYDFIDKQCDEILKIMDGMWITYIQERGRDLECNLKNC